MSPFWDECSVVLPFHILQESFFIQQPVSFPLTVIPRMHISYYSSCRKLFPLLGDGEARDFVFFFLFCKLHARCRMLKWNPGASNHVLTSDTEGSHWVNEWVTTCLSDYWVTAWVGSNWWAGEWLVWVTAWLTSWMANWPKVLVCDCPNK